MELTKKGQAGFPELRKISVSGFKSIRDEQSIDIKNLTILAGANSSGKSSMMQPLLLLKQTLEAPFDPGPLLLNGPNVKFTMAEQLLSWFGAEQVQEFKVGLTINDSTLAYSYFRKPNAGFEISSCKATHDDPSYNCILKPGMTIEDIEANVPQFTDSKQFSNAFKSQNAIVVRNRCFLEIEGRNQTGQRSFRISLFEYIQEFTEGLIHLPALRGNPERAYPVTGVGDTFSGTFEVYTASIISNWQERHDNERIQEFIRDFERLGLTTHIEARRLNDAQVELLAGRLPKAAHNGTMDLVNITDVGFGVSQILPVITALHVANPGQILYLDQPELHLHPRAQVAMAGVLADAAKRGVKLIIETHSKLLLLGIQTLIAEGNLSPDLVSLNWFERDREGVTRITKGELDEYGRFGDWPEDFDDVSLNAESRYLDAIDKRMAG